MNPWEQMEIEAERSAGSCATKRRHLCRARWVTIVNIGEGPLRGWTESQGLADLVTPLYVIIYVWPCQSCTMVGSFAAR